MVHLKRYLESPIMGMVFNSFMLHKKKEDCEVQHLHMALYQTCFILFHYKQKQKNLGRLNILVTMHKTIKQLLNKNRPFTTANKDQIKFMAKNCTFTYMMPTASYKFIGHKLAFKTSKWHGQAQRKIMLVKV